MPSFREIETQVLRNGRIDGPEVEILRQMFPGNTPVTREAADFLAVLHKRVRQRTPAFDKFFFNAIKRFILADGRITATETEWLRQLLFHDGALQDEERKLLNELKGEAREVGPEFEQLLKECMKLGPEARTSGHR